MIHVYDEGEHPSGFVGIRVAVKVGEEYRQQYFNYWNREKYKWASAAEEKRLLKEATALEVSWKTEAATLLRKARLKPKCTSSSKRQIAFGFTYQLKIEKKNRRDKTEVFIYPVFSVFVSTAKRYKVFYVSKEKGGEATFRTALDAYAKLRNLTPAEKKSIQPPTNDNWKAARKALIKEGYDFPMSRLKEYQL